MAVTRLPMGIVHAKTWYILPTHAAPRRFLSAMMEMDNPHIQKSRPE